MIISIDTGKDILALEDDDKTKNVVSSTSLQFEGKLRRGSVVSMPWLDSSWTGRVVAVDGESSCSSYMESDDIPLARFLPKKQVGADKLPVLYLSSNCLSTHELNTRTHIWTYMKK